MADVSVINVTSLTPIVAAAIVSGQQVTIYDQGGVAYRAEVQELVGAAQRLNECLCVNRHKLTLSSAQILAMNTTPIPFGITVPTGYYIQPLSFQFRGVFGTTPYATNVDPEIRYIGATNVIVDMAGTLNFASSTLQNILLNASFQNVISAVDLEITESSGNPTAGDSTVDIYMTYVLIEL